MMPKPALAHIHLAQTIKEEQAGPHHRVLEFAQNEFEHATASLHARRFAARGGARAGG